MLSLLKKCTFTNLFLMLCSCAFATEVLDNEASRYFDADLVIVGEILACSTKTIEEKDSPGNNGWFHHYTKFMNTHLVRVDSVMKGAFADSTIIIKSESSKGYDWKSELVSITEKGDSLFNREMSLRFGGESWANIPDSGKYIILLVVKDSVYTPILCRDYDKSTIDFYREIEGKGEEYLKKFGISPD